ncbi:MAG: type II toxin-antitoxin system PemK/MazF family toxin [Nocardiopsaceae bacterium]|nr:type II toxin-antitoxin system PemK/MazF family toxin [Nocardiopsaceae bacterium]
MKRGEIWRVETMGRDRLMLIMSLDAVNENDRYFTLLAVPVVDRLSAPDSLLTVSIHGEVDGVARIDQITTPPRKRFTERLGAVSEDELASVERALVVFAGLEYRS